MKKTLTLVLVLSLVLGLFAAFPAFAAEAETVTAEWKPGQLYDEAEPVAHTKRYYTVIPCKEGDVFEFDASSGKWGGWLYPADDNGAISSGVYYELKAGEKLTYTVKAEEGKMPTKLRLTVYTHDRIDITEDIWKTFDVKITKTAAVVPEKTYPGVEQTLDWKPGSFYDKAEPNVSQATTRRYVVVPCVEGDIFTFAVPTNWRVWVYPAYDTGSDNSYFEAKEDTSYTVEKKDGKAPVALRVTACPEPDKALTDDEWKALDVKVFKQSFNALDLEWAGGAFYDKAEPNTGLATTRKYVVVPCTEGETIKVVSPSNGWQIWIYPADENGSIEGKYYGLKGGDTYTVEAINGKMPTTLRITAHLREDNTTLSDDAWAARDLVILSDRVVEEEPPATSDASTVALALTAFAALAVVTGVVVLRKRTVRG